MEWLIPAIFGWCGTIWPPKCPPIPWPDPWPPGCWICGGIIGGISAVVLTQLAAGQLAGAGFFALAATSFFAGSVGNTIVGNVLHLIRGNK